MSDPDAQAADPLAWLGHAESCLALARAGHGRPAVLLQDLCFTLQQAVEKALKALLISCSVDFPKTHAIARLLTLAERAGVVIPENVKHAIDLTPYAVRTCYPGGPAIMEEEYQEAMRIAVEVLAWVRRELAAE